MREQVLQDNKGHLFISPETQIDTDSLKGTPYLCFLHCITLCFLSSSSNHFTSSFLSLQLALLLVFISFHLSPPFLHCSLILIPPLAIPRPPVQPVGLNKTDKKVEK